MNYMYVGCVRSQCCLCVRNFIVLNLLKMQSWRCDVHGKAHHLTPNTNLGGVVPSWTQSYVMIIFCLQYYITYRRKWHYFFDIYDISNSRFLMSIITFLLPYEASKQTHDKLPYVQKNLSNNELGYDSI